MGKTKINIQTVTVAELLKQVKKECSKSTALMVKANIKDVNIEGDILDFRNAIPHDMDARITFEHVTFDKVTSIMAHKDTTLVFKRCTFKNFLDFECGDLDIDRCKMDDIVVCANHSDVSLSNLKLKPLVTIEVNDARNVTLDECKGFERFFCTRISSSVSVLDSDIEDVTVYNGPGSLLRVKECKLNEINVSEASLDRIVVTKSEISKHIKLKRTSIYNDLEIRSNKIKTLSCDMAALFGEFYYNPAEIEKLDFDESIGFKPPENEFTMYKTCHVHDAGGELERVIVQLTVPAKANRVYCGHLKIRVSEAKVVKFFDLDGKPYKLRKGYKVCADYDNDFVYRIGKIVKPISTFEPESGACGPGIHGFVKFVDAVKYE